MRILLICELLTSKMTFENNKLTDIVINALKDYKSTFVNYKI